MAMTLKDISNTVNDTIAYIRKKYPNEQNTMDRWLVIIGEEYGEICRAIQDGDVSNAVEEMTQTIAALFLMCLDFCNNENIAPIKLDDACMEDTIEIVEDAACDDIEDCVKLVTEAVQMFDNKHHAFRYKQYDVWDKGGTIFVEYWNNVDYENKGLSVLTRDIKNLKIKFPIKLAYDNRENRGKGPKFKNIR